MASTDDLGSDPAPLEIERKFRVAVAPARPDQVDAAPIRQGYLAVAGEDELRIRQIGRECLLTIKRGTGMVRTEHELPLSRDLFDALWPLTEGLRLQKQRYRIPFREFTIELDEYEGELAGLLIAEVEFSDPEAAEAFEVPGWFGDEVTEDARYKNRALAAHGIPSG